MAGIELLTCKNCSRRMPRVARKPNPLMSDGTYICEFECGSRVVMRCGPDSACCSTTVLDTDKRLAL